MTPRDPVLQCESHPNTRVRVASVIVAPESRYTVAATSDWELSKVMLREVLRHD